MEEKILSIAHAPNQKLQAEIVSKDTEGLAFRILYDGTLVLSSSRLGIRFSDPDADSVPAIKTHAVRPLPFGGTELEVRLTKGEREFGIRFLVSDDRVAFRYEFDRIDDTPDYRERTSFHLALDGTSLSEEPESGLAQDRILPLPALFELDNGLYMSLDRLPNSPEVYALRMADGRRLDSQISDTGDTDTVRTDDVTPWWVISFTHP